ncbi:mannosyltransferase [Madurella fahalii]|uniref:Mannosyltransferase n=1 Tax=Madurella fahalii TaxID=1157608 RepID=A0ABQ0G597_9PEZI
MRPSSSLPYHFTALLLFTTLLLCSTLLGAAAIARSARPPFPFSSSPQRQPTQPTPPKDPVEFEETKYFQEAGYTEELTHYDARFFRGVIPYSAHRAVLRHLIRSYLSTCESLGVETWLAHGTLLGWWWNGRIIPWDYDVDAQVSGATLAALAARHNGSVHEYTYTYTYADEDEAGGAREARAYLLDVNPNYAEVGRRQGKNVIDARWIDLDTGMFVDITGLVERNPDVQPGVWSCKNYHGYRTEDLWPLRETRFEGLPARVPFEFESILVEEYGAKSLVVTEWEGHRWNEDLKEWVKMNQTGDGEML